MSISITSNAFSEGGMIPAEYTCDGKDISPQISWSGIPKNTRSIVLIADDPDAPAGTWVHWVVYNIPPERKVFGKGIQPRESLDDGTMQGKNDFGRIGYGGPCPPGGTHRYYFRIYALKEKPDVKPGLTKKQIMEKIKDLIVSEGHLMGKYGR